MKKLFLCLLLVTFSSNAQLGGLIKKAKDKVEKKVEDKIDGKTDNKSSNQSTTNTSNSSTSTDNKPSNSNSTEEPNKSEGITSPSHQKYLNKIVFASSDKSIGKKSEIEADFKSEFTVGEPIYFRVYLSTPFYYSIKPFAKNESSISVLTNCTLGFNFYLDDVLLDNLYDSKLDERAFETTEKQQWTTFKGALKSVNNTSFIGMSQFANVLRIHEDKFKSGKHKFKIEIFPIIPGHEKIKGDIIASGEITLNVKGNLINPNDPIQCLPTAVMKDDALVKSIAKAHSTTGFKVNPSDVRIISSTWNIVRNKYSGITEKRTLDIYAGYKDTTNNRCYKMPYTISQEYVGSQFLSDIKFNSDILRKTEISCSCLYLK